MVLNNCIVCVKRTTPNQVTTSCATCHKLVHESCSYLSSKDPLKYMCNLCFNEIFPFNYIIDDIEFLNVLLTFFDDFPSFSECDLNGPRLQILNNFKLLRDRDLSADLNVYNKYDVDSRYYLPGSIPLLPNLQKASDNFTVLHLNARSMLHKRDHIEHLMQIISVNIDIIAVSETWETDINTDLIKIPGYNKCSRHRLNNETGGGVALFIHNSIEYSAINSSTKTFESVFVDLKTRNKGSTIIGAIYRPPGGSLADFNEELDSLLTSFTRSNNKNLILAGDYNINLLNHNHHEATESFLNIMYSHRMLPMIKRPTRYGDSCATLIDNIFTNLLSESNFSGIVLDDISDHLPIFFITQYYKPITNKIITKTIRCMTDEAISDLVNKLNDTDWSVVDNKGTDEAYNIFHDLFDTAYNTALPLQIKKFKLRSHTHKPWITTSILNSIRKKHKLYKKYLSSKLKASKDSYVTYKNKLTKIIRAAEKKYYSEKFDAVKDNIRDTWRLINKVLTDTTTARCKHTVAEIRCNDMIIDDPKTIVEKFNEYFVNIGPSLAKNIPVIPNKTVKDTLPNSNKDSLFLEPCTPNEIQNIVNSLKNSKGLGLDGFSTSIIKQIITTILSPLTTIFNKSLESGVFPEKLKLAKVTPIYKSDDKKLLSNYRPISVLPIFSKILEKLMYVRLEKFIEKHNILCENQFGFREKHSTYMALLDICDQITHQLDSKAFSLGIFIDLSKAFDTIDHNILIAKLENYGVRGIALNWYKSYLTNRKQCVEIDGNTSTLKSITCGVPQGSILGPLLFLIYINDIVHVSPLMKFILFADDTNLLLHDKNLPNLILKANTEIQKISDWLKVNKLSLNIKKLTTYYFISDRKKHQINFP